MRKEREDSRAEDSGEGQYRQLVRLDLYKMPVVGLPHTYMTHDPETSLTAHIYT